MMLSNYNTKQKQTSFKAYQSLLKLENALKQLKEASIVDFQISILGKVAQFYSDKDSDVTKDDAIIKTYWKNQLGKSVSFGCFYNPESGSVFIVGPLVTTFLHKINGKSLATLSSGPYGIFRGIGVSELQATSYLKLLNSGDYLLILRAYEAKIQELDMILNNSSEN